MGRRRGQAWEEKEIKERDKFTTGASYIIWNMISQCNLNSSLLRESGGCTIASPSTVNKIDLGVAVESLNK